MSALVAGWSPLGVGMPVSGWGAGILSSRTCFMATFYTDLRRSNRFVILRFCSRPLGRRWACCLSPAVWTNHNMSRKSGKKYTAAASQVERKPYAIEQAVPLVQKVKFAKFDETVELH